MLTGYAGKESFESTDADEGSISEDHGEGSRWAQDRWEWQNAEMVGDPFDPTIESQTELFAEYGPDALDDSAELAEALRDVLHKDYKDATTEEMQDALDNILATMTPAEESTFTNVLRQTRGGHSRSQCGWMPCSVSEVSGSGPLTRALQEGGSAAAAQLLQLFQNPEMLKSLTALSLGSHGRESIKVGKFGPSVNVGRFMNLLDELASNATADADQFLTDGKEASTYRFNSEGYDIADPAAAEERAQALYDALISGQTQGLTAEAAPAQPWSSFFPFPKGTKLLVEYEHWLNNWNIGNGIVLERTSNLLKAKLHIDKQEK
ncbi:MAG: hypothetical protein PVG06_17770, partial [Desulfobacterales bacterium]